LSGGYPTVLYDLRRNKAWLLIAKRGVFYDGRD
jgi:hypothetical protein